MGAVTKYDMLSLYSTPPQYQCLRNYMQNLVSTDLY